MARFLKSAFLLFFWAGILMACVPQPGSTSIANSTPVVTPSSALSIRSTLPIPSETAIPEKVFTDSFVTVIPGSEVNVRSGPATLYPRIGSLKDGEKARAVGKIQGGDWIEIVYPAGQEGTAWVYASLVRVSPPEDLPVVSYLQSNSSQDTAQGSPAELAAIRAFNPAEVLDAYTLERAAFDPNLSHLSVDLYHVNGALYALDPGTNRVVEFEASPLTIQTEAAAKFTSDQLKQMAIQLIAINVPGKQLNRYYLETSNKGTNIFFRWSAGKPGELGYQNYVQVSYTQRGQLLGYIQASMLE
jgi:hypothetical protein